MTDPLRGPGRSVARRGIVGAGAAAVGATALSGALPGVALARPARARLPTRQVAGPETVTLAGYRQRHAQYKTDPDLQAARAVAPWLGEGDLR